MSSIVVLIGYILLIPSILGMTTAAITCAGTGAAVGEVNLESERGARRTLQAAGIPAETIDRVISRQPVPTSTLDSLSDDQRRVVSEAQTSLTASTIGTGAGAALAGLGSAAIFVMSLVGGLLGWLLVMKKAVLQCTGCGAVIAAS